MLTAAEICETIALDLKERKITHKELAEMIGKSKAVVSTQISGKKRFSKVMASLFSRALGYNINFLLYGEGTLLDNTVVRDVVGVPSLKNGELDVSVLAGLIQVAEDLFYMLDDEHAIEAWKEINRGNYQGYLSHVNSLVSEHQTELRGSPILSHYICEQIQSKLYVLIRETKI